MSRTTRKTAARHCSPHTLMFAATCVRDVIAAIPADQVDRLNRLARAALGITEAGDTFRAAWTPTPTFSPARPPQATIEGDRSGAMLARPPLTG
jgi:hypothetical protein